MKAFIVRVDLAEHPDDSGAIEPHGFRPSGGVASEVEPLGLRQREHVVVGAIVVGKVHRRADGDRQQVRHERLAALVHPRVDVFALLRLERAFRRRLEVDDRSPPFRRVAGRPFTELTRCGPAFDHDRHTRKLDAPADAGTSRLPGGHGRHGKAPRKDARGRSRQNHNVTCAAGSVS
jgi:hypothetical protein